MTIYLITNLINGKKYVGQTIQSVKRRWDFHVCNAGGCVALKSAIKKYGKENFKIESIYEASSLEELSKKESEYIVSYNTLAPNGYNLTTGGERPVFSEETRKRMSEAGLGRVPWNKGLTKEDPRIDRSTKMARKAMREKFGESGPNKGHKWSDEAREKASERMTGNVLSKDTKNKISESNMGKKKPNGFSKKMSQVKDSIKIKVLCHQTGLIYESISLASKETGINPGHIQRIIKGTLKKSKGHTFEAV